VSASRETQALLTRRAARRGRAARGAVRAGVLAAAACLAALVVSWLVTTPEEADASAGTRGLAPLSGDRAVPLEWMPPGTNASPLPSDEIFPPQTITIRFDHQRHVEGIGLSCKSCHAAAYDSLASADRLLPDPTETCDNCHDTDHRDLAAVKAGEGPIGQCGFCHVGAEAGAGGRVARTVIPEPQLRFPHKKHLDRNIDCGQCHGHVEKLELATREQLPRMAGCFNCHAMSGAAQGEAKGECITCHLTDRGGKMDTTFATGPLLPPEWLHMAGHTPDWIDRHKTIAANDSKFCASCHTEESCAECHDGRVRNRKVHPNDWISMHPEAARMDNPRCTSCHQLQTFCADCHRRVGVARDIGGGSREIGRRFHPPPEVWTTTPRGPSHHAWEAQRNLNACVSCHSERDCATCHATRGVGGGMGVNPHPLGFASRCGSAMRKNPRPCLVCHASGDGKLELCR
jgi:hypothetical protein